MSLHLGRTVSRTHYLTLVADLWWSVVIPLALQIRELGLLNTQ